MSDGNQVRRAAADHVQMMGSDAVDWLMEQAEIAEATGDREGGKTWYEIADAASAILADRDKGRI
jgi:hypothetical protein